MSFRTLLGLFVLSCLTNLSAADRDQPFGLEKRTPWTTSRVKGSPEPPLPYRPQRVFPNVKFDHPVVISNAAGTTRLFVGEQRGKIFWFDPKAADPKPELLLDANDLVKQLSDKDEYKLEALYGMTFHPKFAENREFFVTYVVNFKNAGKNQHPDGTRIVRLKMSPGDKPHVDPKSEQLVISLLQGGHNGGCLKFGPDGYLYISTGDGSFAYPPDTLKTGQDISDLNSSVLRIDVDHPQGDKPYTIPADNPFVHLPKARGEVWSYGYRNPWKMSFDRKTGELWIGDVGWELWEMIFRARKGDNFGWSVMEGRQPVNTEWERGPTPIQLPTLEIPHTDGVSVTGGLVYRGKKFPELVGTYIFGDWETRRIWGTNVDQEKLAPYVDIADPTVRIVDFAEDNDNEFLLLDYDDGTLLEFVRNEPNASRPKFPTKLSETGLLRDVTQHQPADGVLAFSINAEQWNDFATSERFVALPDNGTIKLLTRRQRAPGSMFERQMEWPIDSVLMKTLSLEMKQGDPSTNRRIETQILHFTGRDWQGYTYEWNDAQTDAVLVERNGKEKSLTVVDPQAPGGKREQRWRFFARGECVRCHNPWTESALAFNLQQLNRDHDFGSVRDNQIRTYRHIGMIEDVVVPFPANNWSPITESNAVKSETEMPRLANPYDPSADLQQRARAYLHINCAHCHRNGGGGSAYLHLNFELKLRELKAFSVRPSQGTFGIHEAQLIAPGDPYRSTLFLRLAKSGPGHMPAIGSRLIDRPGLALMHDWIKQLPTRLDEIETIERLALLDEASSLAKAAQIAPLEKQRLALNIAKEAKRDEPNAEDQAAAEKRYAEEEQVRVKLRAKEREKLIAEVLANPSRALVTARALENSTFSPAIREQILAAAVAHIDGAVRDVFEAFLPDDQRVKRLGDNIDPAAILAMKGNPEKGRAWFESAASSQCRNCHKVGKVGKELGPELTQIAKRLTRAKILENILNPAQEIAPQYVTWLVETEDGKVVSGLLVKRDDQEVVLKDAQLKEHRFKPKEIERIVPQQKSLMPELLLKELTLEQVADLLAFLETLN